MITAELNNYRQSPRKVRLLADLIKGKKVSNAQAILNNIEKRAASPLGKLLNSAIANAKHNFQMDADALSVKDLRVDAGVTLKRMMPRARGSAYAIRKRSSRVVLTLAETAPKMIKSAKKADTSAQKLSAKKPKANK